jgi:hypothetical protein
MINKPKKFKFLEGIDSDSKIKFLDEPPVPKWIYDLSEEKKKALSPAPTLSDDNVFMYLYGSKTGHMSSGSAPSLQQLPEKGYPAYFSPQSWEKLKKMMAEQEEKNKDHWKAIIYPQDYDLYNDQLSKDHHVSIWVNGKECFLTLVLQPHEFEGNTYNLGPLIFDIIKEVDGKLLTVLKKQIQQLGVSKDDDKFMRHALNAYMQHLINDSIHKMGLVLARLINLQSMVKDNVVTRTYQFLDLNTPKLWDVEIHIRGNEEKRITFTFNIH